MSCCVFGALDSVSALACCCADIVAVFVKDREANAVDIVLKCFVEVTYKLIRTSYCAAC